MNNPRDQHQEPSIEEVLASIRRVVTADREQVFGTGSSATEAVMVSDSNEVINLKPMSKYTTEAAATQPEPDPSDSYQPEPPQPESADTASVSDFPAGEPEAPAKDPEPDAASSDYAPSGLHTVVEPAVDSLIGSATIAPMLRDWLEQNLPDMVEHRLKTLLRPLLKEWFDTNLPAMVDRIVHDEVERIVSASGD